MRRVVDLGIGDVVGGVGCDIIFIFDAFKSNKN